MNAMDRLKLSRIDEELESSEVDALRFLCRDVVNRKRLETVDDAKGLFLRLEDKGLLNEGFLSELLQTIGRADLVNVLRTDGSQWAETDASPTLSHYRVMLYRIHEDITQKYLEMMKFLLKDKLGGRQIEMCKTALDVFTEMEKKSLMSNTNLKELYTVLQEFDQPLAETVKNYIGLPLQPPLTSAPHSSRDYQNTSNHTSLAPLSISETNESIFSDAELTTNRTSSVDDIEYYRLTHNPHGLCVVINNEMFKVDLRSRAGTQEDARALNETFTSLGFKVEIHNNLTAAAMKILVTEMGKRDFQNDDALVVCVLSHGEHGCVFGSDEIRVALRDLTQPFTSEKAVTLAGKPKLFFIQACQGSSYQRGSSPCAPKEDEREPRLEEDAGPMRGDTVPSDADFLIGMATVPECKSFRSTTTGSIYIQELCKQLKKSAQSSAMDDILTVLTRVNRNVSKGVFLSYKQMPEPKYTLTKKLVLRYV